MNNELINFHHEMFGDIRAIEKDGESWFVGKDVAETLGYNNTRDALYKHVDEEDKIDGVAFRDTIGREQKMTIIRVGPLLPRSLLEAPSMLQTKQLTFIYFSLTLIISILAFVVLSYRDTKP